MSFCHKRPNLSRCLNGGTLNLLRLEGKAHHFCLKGFIKICDYTFKVQLFWILKLFVLILTQLFGNKIIRCFGVQQTHPTQIPHNKDRIKKQLVAYCLVLLAHLQCLCSLNVELEHSMLHLIFQKAVKLCNNFIFRILYCCLISCAYGYFITK